MPTYLFTTLHRFTPPTCTLEIKGKKSPLSRWQNQDLLKKIQFKLSFDDPRLPSSQQVTIKGDRQDLETLKIAVNNYIQNFLHASFKSEIEDKKKLQPDRDRLDLQPVGLVNHELFFGNLERDSSANKIKLTTVQLFDLSTALEAYDTQISALPKLNQAQSKSIIPLWGGIAAAFVVVSGITAMVMKTTSMQNVASSSRSQSSNSIPQLDEVLPPPIPKSTEPTPKPKPNKTLSSTKKLPPPPAVDTPKPKPDIPDPADYPLSQVARQSGLNRHQNPKSSARQTESVITIPPENAKEESDNPQEDRSQLEIIPELAAKTNSDLNRELDRSNSVNSDGDMALNSSQANHLQKIEAYFSNKWQPPADLKQSLEYRLYLNSNGAIARVIPIGKASKLYLSKTKIPVRGEAFIAPITDSQSSIIRLLLNPDGGVKAFAEFQ